MKKLILPTLGTFLIGVVILGLLLFLPAGTIYYWQGWVFILVFMLSTNALGLYLSLNDPELLEKRKKAGPTKEESPIQRLVMMLLLVGIVAVFIVSGLDFRFGWSHMPVLIVLLGDVMVAAGLLANIPVFKANSYSGATVEIFDDQKVISTGPYGIVRHPMYSVCLVMALGVPLALGSWVGLVVMLFTIPALILRILDEEKLLKKDLPGYMDYTQKVPYRLVPHLW
jgi:protein-S-isoprenylcysteine O-methyltransferase Ste14